MQEINYDSITNGWTETILQGEDKVSLGNISSTEMPERLKEIMLERGNKVLEDEIKRFLSNPFFDLSGTADDGFDVHAELNKVFADKIVIPAESVSEIVDKVFREMVENWQAEPISFREAAENLDNFADEIFQRIENYTSLKPGESGFELDLIAGLCELSGLDSLAQAIQLESQLGVKNLNRVDFMLITDRFLKLVRHYKVERKLTSFVGAGKTLFPSTLSPEPEPPGEFEKGLLEEESILQPVKDDLSEELPVGMLEDEEPDLEPVEDDLKFGIDDDGTGPSSLEDLLREEIGSDGSNSDRVGESILDDHPLSEDETPDGIDLDLSIVDEEPVEQIEEDEITDLGIEKLPSDNEVPEVSLPEEPEPPVLELTVDSELARMLMEDETRNYFVSELFDGDLEGYRMMSERICQAADMNRALIIADNELFMLDIPAVAEQASRLLNLIREKYNE